MKWQKQLNGFQRAAKLLKPQKCSHDHRTIKSFVWPQLRKTSVEKEIFKLGTRDLRRIRQELSRNPLDSSVFALCSWNYLKKMYLFLLSKLFLERLLYFPLVTIKIITFTMIPINELKLLTMLKSGKYNFA